MKKILVALLVVVSSCSHTTEEKYDMINKIVGELSVINDSLGHLHYDILTNMPGSDNYIQIIGKDTIYASTFIDSLMKSKATDYGNKVNRYNELGEKYKTYKDIYSRIYNQLPKDSAAKNEAIQQRFLQAIEGR